MTIKKVKLTGIKSFEEVEIDLSPGINIFVGPNNSGKSTILQSLHYLQAGNLSDKDQVIHERFIRAKTKLSLIEIILDLENPYVLNSFKQYLGETRGRKTIDIRYKNDKSNPNKTSIYIEELVGQLKMPNIGENFKHFIPMMAPDNLFFPYLSRRKTSNFSEVVSLNSVRSANGTHEFLNAKVDDLASPGTPKHQEFIEQCNNILGFSITTVASDNGKKAALRIDNFHQIFMDSMGEGIPNILGLIVDLCIAESKVFLIEEIENDLHPQALKKMLDFILNKSKNNQILITTHSNIVLKHLGSKIGSKIFELEMSLKEDIPTTSLVLADFVERSESHCL